MADQNGIPDGVNGTITDAVADEHGLSNPGDNPMYPEVTDRRCDVPESGSTNSQGRAGRPLVGVDLQRISDLINGKLQNPRPVTLKSVIRQQLGNIRSAQRRGLTIREIADAITEAGCPIGEVTLRKYVHLLSNERNRLRRSSKRPAPSSDAMEVQSSSLVSAATTDPASAVLDATRPSTTERTFRRARLLANPANHEREQQ